MFQCDCVQKPKAVIAAQSLLEINPHIQVDTHTNKGGRESLLWSCDQVICDAFHTVEPATEKEIYNDTFFQQQNVSINALDNLEARRYMDRYM